MNNVVEKFKKGSKIHIKESLKGSFTKWCGGNVTSECILRGKNSNDPKIRKKATFAANARKWKHQMGGPIRRQQTPIKRLKDGFRYIPNENGGWTRITDDAMSDLFATLEVTPKRNVAGSDITRKQLPKTSTYRSAYHPEDAVKFFNIMTLGGLNNLSPTLWARRGYDLEKLILSKIAEPKGGRTAMTWNGFVDSWINGNNGVVSLKFSEEHPYWSMGINGVLDAATLGGASNASKINKAIEYAPKATKVAFDVAKSNKNPLNFRNYGFLRDSRFYSDLDNYGIRNIMGDRALGNYPLTFAERRNYVTNLKSDIQKGVDYAIDEARTNLKAPLKEKFVKYGDDFYEPIYESLTPKDIQPLKLNFGTLKATKLIGGTPWDEGYGAFQNPKHGLFFPFRDKPNTLRTHSMFTDTGERISTGAHETRHTVLSYLDVPLTENRWDMPGSYGRYTNRNLPLDFKKKVNSYIADAETAGEWLGSLSEMDAELTGWSAQHGFPRYSQMSARQKAQLHDLFLKRFGGNTDYNDAVYNLLRNNKILNPMAVKREVKKLDESKIGQILLGLEELGYRKHGGKMIKKAQYGAPLNLSTEDIQGGLNYITQGLGKVWNIMNAPVVNVQPSTTASLPNGSLIEIPGTLTGVVDDSFGKGGGGKKVGKKLLQSVAKSKDKGLNVTKKVDSSVRHGLVSVDQDLRHFGGGNRRMDPNELIKEMDKHVEFKEFAKRLSKRLGNLNKDNPQAMKDFKALKNKYEDMFNDFLHNGIKKHLEGAKLTFGLKLGNFAKSDLGKSVISNGLNFLLDKLFNKSASSNLEIALAAQEKELPTIDPTQVAQMIEMARNQYADPENPNANGGDIFNSYIKNQITAPILARQLEEHKKRLAAIDLLKNQAKSSAVGTFFNTLAQGGIEYLLNKYGTTEKADS